MSVCTGKHVCCMFLVSGTMPCQKAIFHGAPLHPSVFTIFLNPFLDALWAL